MSTQAISGLSIYQELQAFYQNRQTDLQTLGNALQSGDLNAAQQAYKQLVGLGQSGPFGNQEPFARANRAQDFEAIGKALSSGDLAGAQAAFAQLQQALGQSKTAAASNSPAYQVSLGNTQAGTAAATTSSGGAGSIYQQLQAFRSTRSADLQQLSQALTAGDLNGAQQAYNGLVRLGQQGPFADSGPFQRSDRTQDFQAIGKALQSGDLAGAQQAFATLQGTFDQKLQGGPVSTVFSPGEGTATNTPAAQAVPEIIINIGASASSPPSNTTPELVLNLPTPANNSQEEVQINFGGGGNSQANQLTIELGQTQGQNGAAGEQITIDLSQANNNQNIVLNLFGAGSSATSQSQGSALNVQG